MIADLLLLLAGSAAGWCLLGRPAGRFTFRGSTLLGFFVLSIGVTSPLLLRLDQMMLASGAGTDAFIGVWDLWWAREALTRGLDPLETSWVFHPHGTNLALHTLCLTYGILSVPVQLLVRPIYAGMSGVPASSVSAGQGAADPGSLFVVYNLVVLASFTLSGYLTYRLARSVIASRLPLPSPHPRTAAIVAGVLFACTNYRFANTVRLHVLGTEFLVLCVWAWFCFLRRPDARRLLLFAGAGVLVMYNSLEYAAYVPLLCLVLAAGSIPGWRAVRIQLRGNRLRGSWRIAVGSLAVVLAVVPLVAALLRRSGEGATSFDPRLAAFFSADLLDFFLPNPRHPLWGSAFRDITAGFHRGDSGFGLTIGWSALALFVAASAALFSRRRGKDEDAGLQQAGDIDPRPLGLPANAGPDPRVWFWGAIVFLILALGPELHVAGRSAGLPLPQAIVAKVLPFLGGSRTPIRYMAPAWVCLAITIAAGWASWERRRRARVEEAGMPQGAGAAARSPRQAEGRSGPDHPGPDHPGPNLPGLDLPIRRLPGSGGNSSTWRIGAVVTALVWIEALAAPWPMVSVPVPAVYRAAAASLPEGLEQGTALVDLPGMPARESLLYQTVHRQRLVQNVESAMPLRSRRGADAFEDPAWAVLTQGLSAPGWLESLPSADRAGVIGEIRGFLDRQGVRSLVVLRTRPQLDEHGRAFHEAPVLPDAAAEALEAHLGVLGGGRNAESAGQALYTRP